MRHLKLMRTKTEGGLVAVHVAVGAVVPAAADGGLQDQGVGLGGWAVEFADVAHVLKSKRGRWRGLKCPPGRVQTGQ